MTSTMLTSEGMVAVSEIFAAHFEAGAVACVCMHRRSLDSSCEKTPFGEHFPVLASTFS